MKCPIIKKQKHRQIFGVTNNDSNSNFISPPIFLEDDYFWLRDDNRTNKDVLSVLENENKFTNYKMKNTKIIQRELYTELLSYTKDKYDTCPLPENYLGSISNFLYFTRNIKNKCFPLFFRIDKNTNKEELLLDFNKISKNNKNYNFESFKINDNEKLMSYGFETNGNEIYKLVIIDIQTKQKKNHKIPDLQYCDYYWYDDYIYYTQTDSKNRTHQIWKYNINTQENKLLFQENDELFWLDLDFGHCRDNRNYIYISSSSIETDKIYIFKHDKDDEITIFTPVIKGLKYSINSIDDIFILLTKKETDTNFKLMLTKNENTKIQNWKNLFEFKDDYHIQDFVILKMYMIIIFKHKGNTFFKIVPYINKKYNFNKSYVVNLDVDIKNIELEYYHFNEDNITIKCSSLKTPETFFNFNLKTQILTLITKRSIPNYKEELYETKRLHSTSVDNVKVPISIVYKKDKFLKNGKNPLYLYGYGAYGITTELEFSTFIIPLLNKGFIFAIAHVRGDSFLGDDWYKQGRMLNKMNSFYDFISCTEYLIQNKYTNKDLTVIYGASAGGLLVSASMVMRPDIFKTVIADVPFVDVLNTMSDSSIPLTTGEWEEWGNPNYQVFFDYMKKYSPYNNLKNDYYPNLLLRTGLNDYRVGYWEPTKFLAKFRDNNNNDTISLLKVDMNKGHSNSLDFHERIKEEAFKIAFIFKTLGF